MEEARQKIRGFLGKHFRKHQVQDHENIFALGYVNSLFAMQLVMYLEKEFGLHLENQDLNIENLQSIDAMIALLERKRA